MTILVNGEHFQVRENLFHFLKAFRSRYQSQVIWLDAICINQDDVQERSHQVQTMRRIYCGAKCVYSWLGDKPLPHTGILNRQYIIDLYYRCRSDERQDTRRRDQLEYIFQAEYWSRMWIVQEFILAKEVQLLVGRNKHSSSKLLKLYESRFLYDRSTILQQSKAFDLMYYRKAPKNFEALFDTFGMLPRSISVDGVFALLGLLGDSEHGNSILGDSEEDLRLISLIDYSLTVWQLLQRILALNYLTLSPFRFAYQYNRFVIKGQSDDHMGDYVSMELEKPLSWQLCGADGSRYARAEGSPLQMAMAIQASRAIMYHEATSGDTVEIAVYTPRWRTLAVRSGTSVEQCVGLPSLKLLHLRTCALFEACDSRCTTTCATHAIVGFSWTYSHEHGHLQTRDPAPTEMIDVPLLASHASGDVSQLIHNIQQRSMEMVEAISSKVRITANNRFSVCKDQTRYKLETDVETVVLLSTFIEDLGTHKGWQALLDLAMDLIPEPGTEEDATRPK